MAFQAQRDIVGPVLLAYVLLVPFMVFFASKVLHDDAMFFLGTSTLLLGGALYHALGKSAKLLRRQAQVTICPPMCGDLKPFPGLGRPRVQAPMFPRGALAPQDFCMAPPPCPQAKIRPCVPGPAVGAYAPEPAAVKPETLVVPELIPAVLPSPVPACHKTGCESAGPKK